MATYTEAKITPLDFETARSALRSALRAETGSPPSDQVLALALAKTALETGRWQKIWGFNFGNVKADITTYAGMYQCFPCNEVSNGEVVWFSPRGRLSGKGGEVVAEASEDPPGHYQTRFRAYANYTDGAYEYVFFQARGKRYAVAWQCLLAGSVEGYVRALSAAGYFTAPVESYLKTVSALHGEFLRRLKNQPADEVIIQDRWDWQLDAVRAFAVRFDDVGIVRAEALRELSQSDTEPPPSAPPTERDPSVRS